MALDHDRALAPLDDPPPEVNWAEYRYQHGTSSKFWRCWEPFVMGASPWRVDVLFGRIGTSGQRRTKWFPVQPAAREWLGAKVTEKAAKGYVLWTDRARWSRGHRPPATEIVVESDPCAVLIGVGPGRCTLQAGHDGRHRSFAAEFMPSGGCRALGCALERDHRGAHAAPPPVPARLRGGGDARTFEDAMERLAMAFGGMAEAGRITGSSLEQLSTLLRAGLLTQREMRDALIGQDRSPADAERVVLDERGRGTPPSREVSAVVDERLGGLSMRSVAGRRLREAGYIDPDTLSVEPERLFGRPVEYVIAANEPLIETLCTCLAIDLAATDGAHGARCPSYGRDRAVFSQLSVGGMPDDVAAFADRMAAAGREGRATHAQVQALARGERPRLGHDDVVDGHAYVGCGRCDYCHFKAPGKTTLCGRIEERHRRPEPEPEETRPKRRLKLE